MLSKNNHDIWKDNVLEAVAQAGADGRVAADYIRSHGTMIGFKKARPSIGAFWTLSKRIYLNSRHYSYENLPTNPQVLSLLVHEVKHLQQGPFVALSVYGELEAWQTGFRFFHYLTGKYPKDIIAEIVALELSWDRNILDHSRNLMQTYAGKSYRIDLLPLYPINKELSYWIKGK